MVKHDWHRTDDRLDDSLRKSRGPELEISVRRSDDLQPDPFFPWVFSVVAKALSKSRINKTNDNNDQRSN
jgi:hypothetical protein